MDRNITRPGRLDFDNITTYTVKDRKNLVTTENIFKVGDAVEEYTHPDFLSLCEKVAEARRNGRPVILSMGAHVIKCGLSRFLIALLREGIVTHISSNGAGSIHDFELCYNGGTSEDVNASLSANMSTAPPSSYIRIPAQPKPRNGKMTWHSTAPSFPSSKNIKA